MSEQIIATKDQIGSYDAIESLKPGEPVFPLQGGDPLAPLCTMVWANLQTLCIHCHKFWHATQRRLGVSLRIPMPKVVFPSQKGPKDASDGCAPTETPSTLKRRQRSVKPC